MTCLLSCFLCLSQFGFRDCILRNIAFYPPKKSIITFFFFLLNFKQIKKKKRICFDRK